VACVQPSAPAGLKESDGPLWDRYDLAMLDLDGVVYIGPNAIPGVPAHLEAAERAGMHLAYITNNASRPPDVVAEHLVRLGVDARVDDVVTSAQAAARLVAERVPQGSPVYVIGGAGLFVALTELGLVPVQQIDDLPVAVVSGFAPDLRWETVIDGAILVRRGLPWVASNTDATVPTAHGPGLGNGVLVGVVAAYAGRQPVVAGKPQPPLFRETVLRVGGSRPLVVGDRLDTDIQGAVGAGYDSLLVMTGVTGVAELTSAPPELRPTYVGSTLAALGTPHPVPDAQDDTVSLGGWTAGVADGRLTVTGQGSVDDWWRVVAATGWRHLDETGAVAHGADLVPPGNVTLPPHADAAQQKGSP
jgi:HAD superfamily hydrolase (TIGR01450 family)